MIANFYTASSAAEEIGCSISTVTRWAERLGMGDKRHGTAFTLTKKDVEAIRKSWHGRSGNPEFGKAGTPRK